MTIGIKITFWTIYTLILIGVAYLIDESFYIYHFWKWVLS